MPQLRIVFIVISVLIFGGSIAAQNHYHQYTTADGLPQNTINHIHQDPKGFLWLGTPDGLARFDGYDYEIWRANFKDSNALKGNGITGVVQDTSDRIWICTGTGAISRYNPKTDEWRNYQLDSARNSPYSNSAYFPLLVGDTALWYIGGWALQKVLITEDKPVFEHFYLNKEHEHKTSYILRNFVFDGDQRLWMASPIGLVAFNLKTEKFEVAPGQQDYPLDSALKACEFDHNGDLWLASFTKPAQIVRRNRLKPGAIGERNPYVPKEIDQSIFRIKRMPNGQMYLMGNHGLYACDYQNQTETNVAYDESHHLHKRLVWDATIDKDKNLWIGSETGLYCDFAVQGAFEAIKNTSPKSPSNITYRILQDSQSRLWYGSVNEINLYDEKTEEFSTFNIKLDSVPNQNAVITGIQEDANGDIWVAAYPKLIIIDGQSLAISSIDFEVEGLKSYEVLTSFIQDQSGVFWFGRLMGISTYNPKTKRWRTYSHDQRSYFTSLVEVNDSQIAGVNAYNLYFLHKDSLSAELIPKNPVSKDTRRPYIHLAKMIIKHGDRLFIGAKNGLLSYDLKEKWWELYTTENGLPSNVIRALAADTLGRIWMSTNQGIAYLDINSGKISSFNPHYAIGCLEFKSRAVHVDPDGHIYFGCDEGVLRFNPSDFIPSKKTPPVEFTSFKVFNKEVPVGIKDSSSHFPTLSRSIEYTNSLVLNHHHSVFTIGFTALNYFEPEKISYRHRLVGFEDEWLEDGNNRSLTYTNLDPGHYLLEVQASNSFGIWSNAIYSLPVVVLPPWYATLWARTLMLLLAASLVYFLFMWRIRTVRQEEKVRQRIHAARMQEREDFRRKSAADFHDEAGNKITKINLFTELAHGEINENQNLATYLKGIEQNIKALSAGMRDFLWVMDPDKDTLFDTIYRLQRFGDNMFNATESKFHVVGMEKHMQEIKLSMNVRKAIIQIFKEGIHNCLKHADAPSVTLEVQIEENQLKISLGDTGRGFETESEIKPNHYGLNIMRKRAEGIGAELDINSQLGSGCCLRFTGSLPHLG